MRRSAYPTGGATSSRLLPRFVESPKEKSQRRANGRTTRPVLRGRRSIALSCCRIALAANGEPLTRPAVIVGADVGA